MLGIILAVVIGSSIFIVLYVYLPFQPSQNYQVTYVESGSTISGGSCSQSFPSGLQVSQFSQNRSVVFLMEPNSTAQLCVTYKVQKTDLTSVVSYPLFQQGMWSLHYQCTSTSCSGSGTPGNFTVSTSPSYLTIYPGNSVASIVIGYTIQSGVNSEGFYGFQYLNAFCPRNTPFAVGYNASEVNATDFTGFFTIAGCGPRNNPNNIIGYEDYLSYANITGITNLSYTYVSTNFSEP